MSRHTNEGPMEFEFQNGTGPINCFSPFAQLGQNPQAFPQSTKKSSSGSDIEIGEAIKLISMIQGSYSTFDSPSKPKNRHPTSPSKPLPAPPAFNALFNTPRKTTNDIDDSSAGETPKSPEVRDDSDATPESMSLRSALCKVDAASAPTLPTTSQFSSPVKEKPTSLRRDSWMMKLKSKFNSPGRGEVPRADHSEGMGRKIHRRRKKEVDRQYSRKRRHSVSESGDDDDRLQMSPRKASNQHNSALPKPDQKENWIASFFTFIGQHPTVPHILSFYAQLAFNVFLLGGCAYLIYCFWSAVQGDVDKKSHEAMAEIMIEMALCAKQYKENNCEPKTRMPALDTVCSNWEKCMNQDPARVGRAKVSAHTFAEIFNSFVEPISYKAMIFTAILVFGCFAISNFAFGLIRKTEQSAGFQSYYQPAPPPTPQRSFSGQDGGFYGTPWHQPPAAFEPQPSGGGLAQIEGRGSPVRRLQF
ncbi:hypothetical protein M433DRAFT_135498 [Acidomyces richmondensis BFW]|nr:MAG: hypothetical protein FE78DRAFT_72283 [Acidomyces sp. 'richmondensis']KYG44523.1 hypothetical protein M433DRAFT_135498 [Acidomyces richmondensis BFW]